MIAQPPTSHRASHPPAHYWVLILVLGSFALPLFPQSETSAGQPAGEVAVASPLRISGITVTPKKPGTETLCTLSVQLENSSTRPIFSLVFEVEVGGDSLPVYEKQVYMVPIHPGAKQGATELASTDLSLFNFWTSDSRREPPADGKLVVNVRLIGAQWLEISEDTTKDGQPIEVWTPAGPVPGLPSVISTTLNLAN